MAGSSAVIDLSSDDEDEAVPVIPAPTSATKPVKGLGISIVDAGIAPVPASTPSPSEANKGQLRNVQAGKNGGDNCQESPKWGEPLPPDPDGHTPVIISPRERAASMKQTPHIQKGSDVGKKVRPVVGAKSELKVKIPSSPTSPPPPLDGSDVCRLFWRAGDYEAHPSGVKTTRGAMDHVRVHPKFLHSNATSHKWALGAVAELLDNAVDEISNGATFVKVDKISNPRDKTSALLIQDDGGGMAPDCMRQCMSLGYSRKNTNTTIGQYGNGFKTSTMRLGADVVVFSRCKSGPVVTQSIGLLSYTFLRKTGHEDVVVPMIDYEVPDAPGTLRPSGEGLRKMVRSTLDDWHKNLSTILQWSPYSTEAELLAQFADVGWHGTKVIVYNLWFNDDGILELDFDSDEYDIQLRGGVKQDSGKPVQTQLAQQHIANRYHHSLRVYASILYLQMPPRFQIILRGQPVEHHSLANDLKFPEQIVYKPQIGNTKDPGSKETAVVTIIGFTKEAPLINVHGFNVYHKNRLIMPFWKVWQDNSSRGRGVVGVLEANFVEPAHDKQDFERTAVLMRLETRLKQMTVEYWNLHCHLIGYQPNTKAGKAARKQAAAPPSIEYPAPVASLTPSLPHTSEVDNGVDGVRPSTSKQARSSVPGAGKKSEGPQVKSEPMDFSPESLKRSSSATVSETLRRLKRQRREGTNNSPSSTTEEGETAVADATISTQIDESVMLQLVEENSQLLARISNYEDHTKTLEQNKKNLEAKVIEMEKQLVEEKVRVVRLQQELDEMRMRKEQDASRKDDGRKSSGDVARVRETARIAELVASRTAVPSGASAPTTFPRPVVKKSSGDVARVCQTEWIAQLVSSLSALPRRASASTTFLRPVVKVE
ncbi:hypothetical protein R1flu_000404 [Riccia fluitans]|uniref:Morc S5 domain-containing protein n=1 Tax=Riccia fluitans TaxID=41844 RepID=A0ABD1Y1A3_9MARC